LLPAGARHEDLASALVNYVIGTIALETFWVAMAHGCQTTYVVGGIFDHRVPREAYEEWFQGKAIVSGKVNIVADVAFTIVLLTARDSTRLISSAVFETV